MPCLCITLFLFSAVAAFCHCSTTPHSSDNIPCPADLPEARPEGNCSESVVTALNPDLDIAATLQIPITHMSDLSQILGSRCALLCVSPCDPAVVFTLSQVNQVFLDDPHIYVGLLLSAGDNLSIVTSESGSDNPPFRLVFYEKEIKDRTCLLSPNKTSFKAFPYAGQIVPELIVQFLNEKCGAFRTVTGELNAAGIFHSYIMDDLYHLEDMSVECSRISTMPDQETFFQQFLFRSKPVVIEGGVKNWPAMKRWTAEYLRELYGRKKIHIKLTDDGKFEGVESANLWENYRSDWIPESVKTQLPYPDLVVVRPATAEMMFSEFLDFITSRNQSYSAYLEYSSIPYHLPLLEEDVREMPFLNGLLERKHLNIWLSDGNTLGKLHFDPYDNFLCQQELPELFQEFSIYLRATQRDCHLKQQMISGEKHLTLFEPHHNEHLYEAHIPEAILSFDFTRKKFFRKRLLESTSMVMSPVDITNPDLERFPGFTKARRTECSLRPGDVLFMPAFWWHEVQSYPDMEEKRNIAVNFWYEPMLSKEFPCAECRLQFN